MDKKALTIKDMQHEQRGTGFGLLILCSVIWLYPYATLRIFWGHEAHLIAYLITASAFFVGVVNVLLLIYCVLMFIRSFRRPVVVVATRMESLGVKVSLWHRLLHPMGRRWYYETYVNFHGYGTVPSLSGVLEFTSVGDKFYLLLDGFDHIIAYYPCNEYEYEGELTPSKYEK